MRNICCAPEPNNVQPTDHPFLWTRIGIVILVCAATSIERYWTFNTRQWSSANLWLLFDLVSTTLISNDPAWEWWANIFYLSHAWGVQYFTLPHQSDRTPIGVWWVLSESDDSELCPTRVRSESELSPSSVRAQSEPNPISVRAQSELSPSPIRSQSDRNPIGLW